MTLTLHQPLIERAVAAAMVDRRIAGLAVGGSWVTATMDEFSDLDLVVVGENVGYSSLFEERMDYAGRIGGLLSAFTGEHVGEPRLLICLYTSPLLHVDLKFVSLEAFQSRVEDPVVLWEREGALTNVIGTTTASFPGKDWQWIEDRVWTWFHYAATKLGRGELFECIDTLSVIRSQVLGPMILVDHKHLPRGVRHLEQIAPGYVAMLSNTAATHNEASCAAALITSICLYQSLRSRLAFQTQINEAVEHEVAAYCNAIANNRRT